MDLKMYEKLLIEIKIEKNVENDDEISEKEIK